MKKMIGGIAAAAVGVSLALAPQANAIDDATGDVIFRTTLTNQGLLFNFPLEKYQGQRYCQAIIDGTKPLDAMYDLMRDGGYPFDVANGITSSASIAYCECTEAAVTTGYHYSSQDACGAFELNQPRRRF